MVANEHSEEDTFAAKLNKLFATFLSPNGREYSPEQVAQWLRDNDRPAVSASYIYMLRRGTRDNPTRSHLTALAAFFEVPPAYFFDDDLGQQISDELALFAALRDSDTRYVAMRTSELTADARRSIVTLLREMGWARRSPGPDSDGTDLGQQRGR